MRDAAAPTPVSAPARAAASEPGSGLAPELAAQRRAILILRALAVALVVVPLIVFGVAAAGMYRDALYDARREVDQAATLLQQGYLRLIGANRLATRYVHDVLAELSDADIRAREAALHERLAQITRDLPEVSGVWVIDAAGTPLVSSAAHPMPAGIDASDRAYFTALRDGGKDGAKAVHIGEMIVGRAVPTRSYTFSVPWQTAAGGFRGIIQTTLDPRSFADPAATLARAREMTVTVWRDNGAVLAAHPGPDALPYDALAWALHPRDGSAVVAWHGVDHVMAVRRIGDYPLHVGASIPIGAVVASWARRSAAHLFFGVPATVGLVALTLVALRRTRRLALEGERRRRAEAALRQAQKLEALGQLTGGVAHDFNNLLTVIRGHIELMQDRLGPAHATPVRSMLDAIERGAKLTRQLLTFSRVQVLHPEVIDLRELLPRLRAMIGFSLRGDIDMTIECAPETARVKVDLSELELALLNLAVNARDAMPDGGTLTIAAHNVSFGGDTGQVGADTGLVGDFVAITVRDTGKGIDPALIERVFEPFFTTKPTGQGTGLGLSQVYGFAQQAGGTATVASAPHVGTLVTIYLPVTQDAVEPAPTAAPAAAPRGAARILLIDDNDSVAEVTVALLERLGFTTVRADTASEGLQRFDADAAGFDLVMSDIVMPGGLSGFDLAREVRTRRPDQRIVLMTGYSTAAEDAVRAGFPVLRKPYRKADLNAAVIGALAGAPNPTGPAGSTDEPPGRAAAS